MSQADFDRALQLVLIDEGGNDDDPHDHGGRTSRGITQREYDAWCVKNHRPQGDDVWAASDAEINTIYHEQYWLPYCDLLPPGVDYVFFDDAVNAGPVQAITQLQKALGNVQVDGHMGVATEQATMAVNSLTLIHNYCEVRRTFYRHLAQFPRYGKGWLSRVDHVERGATRMANGAQNVTRPVLPDDLKAQATAKANARDVSHPLVSPQAAAASTAGSTVSAGILDQLHSLSDSLQSLAQPIHYVQYLLLTIALVSAGLTFWGFIQQAKIKAATT
jgi:lysozyme family protein